MPFMQRLGDRWDRRASGLDPVAVQAWILVQAPPRQVWDFLLHPQSALLVTDNVLKVFRVPDSPVGVVGEQLCLLFDRGGQLSMDLVELAVVEPESTLAIRWVTGGADQVRRTTLVSTDDTSTVVTVQLAASVPTDARTRWRTVLQEHVDSSVLRLKTAVESEVSFDD